MANTIHDVLWVVALAVVILASILFWPVAKYVLIGLGALVILFGAAIGWIYAAYMRSLEQNDGEQLLADERPDEGLSDQPA